MTVITKKKNRSRKRMTWITGKLIFIAGNPASLSAGFLGDFTFFNLTMFDFSDYLVSNILMPIGALLIALFVGFKIPRKTLMNEIQSGATYGNKIFALWYLMIKYIVPIAIVIVFLDVIGVLDWIMNTI